MKKLLVTSLITGAVLSTTFTGEAEATKSNINYLNSSVISKAKDGKLSMDGLKVGASVKDLSKTKRYYIRENRIITVNVGYDRTFVDFQNKTAVSKLKVTRIVDKDIDDQWDISRDEILKKYNNPLLTETYNSPYKTGDSRIVDVYKNITFFYKWQAYKTSTPELTGVVIMHNKTKTAQQKWFNYATGEANYMVDQMDDYITSSEWADL